MLKSTFRSAPIDEPAKWSKEGCDLGHDPDSGAMVRRLTSGPMMNNLIYCEQPYTSPDGKRVAIVRGRDFSFENDFSLLVGEPDTLKVVQIERSIPRNIAHNSWSEWLYYMTHEHGLRRVSLLTLEKQQVLPDGALPTANHASDAPDNFSTITPDNRQILGLEGPSIVSYDTKTAERKVLYSHSDNTNSHVQVEPTKGKLIVFQLVARDHVSTMIMNADWIDARQLPIGGDHTKESSGHFTWITGTERVVLAVEWDRITRQHDLRHPQGNLIIAGRDDKKATVFSAPEHAFFHVSVSRCGTYFVCDDFMEFEMDALRRGQVGPVRIVVGNFKTGKYRVLIRDCQTYGISGGCHWEPTPYFTADNRWVIYNSSPFGTNQVFAAQVTKEFLASLG